MTRPTRFIWFILITLLLSACSLSEDITPPPGAVLPSPLPATPVPQGALYPLVAPNPASASAIFAEKCAPCHGTRGLGDGIQAADLPAPPAPIGSAQLARQARPADWYQVVTQGRIQKFMPPFNSLTEGQRWDVVAFLLNLHVSAEELSSGETLFAENCAACHGSAGLGDGDQAPAPMPNFADQKWMAQRSAQDFYSAIVQGVGENMPAFAENFSEQEVWAIAAYLRTLSFQGNAAAGLQGQNSPALPPTATQTTETGGMVTGLVTNASGGTLPQDLAVTLRGFDAMQQTFSETTTIAPDGSFVFSDVPMPMQRAFLVTAEYQEVLYGSDVAVVKDGMMAFDLPFDVYESTRDTSVLSIDRLHLFFEFPSENVVRVGQLYVISNLSNKTLISSDDSGIVTAFSLPEGAGQPQFEDGVLGERYLPIPGGFGDTVQVRPGQGQYQVFVAVDIPYNRRLDFKQQFLMPVDAILVMLPEGQINLSSPYLQAGAPREVQGVQYAVFSGDSIEPTQTLEITLNRRWGAGFSTSTGIILGTAVLGAALLIAGLWMYRRDQQQPHTASALTLADTEDESAEDLNLNTAEALMDAILALDDLYAAGQIPEAVYTTRRARLKARLQEMLD